MKNGFLLLIVSALTFTSCSAPIAPINASSASDTVHRTITVVGEGSASAKPDIARTTIGVQVTAPALADALKQNNDKMNVIVAKIKSLGIADKDIQTSSYSVNPVHNTGKGSPNDIVGYQVSNNVALTIRDLDKAGTVLDQITQAGANNIYGISFAIDNLTKLQTEARAKAMTDAQSRADDLARLAGVARGDVLVVSEVIQSNPVPLFAAAPAAARSADSEPSVETGELSVQMRVQVVYAIR